MYTINNVNHRAEQESYLIEFFRTIAPFKWSIIIITLLAVLLAALHLYFTPSTYESYAILKIKPETQNRQINADDPLGSALAISGHQGVEQEIAILKTFYTNKKAIDKLNLKIQYFKKEKYRKTEIFSNPPIEIKNLTIFDPNILGKFLLLYPQKNGYQLEIAGVKNNKILPYNQEIKTKHFKFTVEKKSNFHAPIYFKLNGSNRNIYEKIVKKNLLISRLSDQVSLIKVAYQDTSPQRATNYVNTLTDIYIAQSIVDKSKKNNKILDFIEEQLLSTGKKLKLSETQLEEYRVSNNVIEPSVQSGSLLEQLSSIEVDLSENKIRRKLVENLLEIIKEHNALESIAPTLRELGDEPTIRLIETLQEMQNRANELSSEYTEKYPELKTLRRDIRRNRRTIARNIKNLQASILKREQNLLERKREYESQLRILPSKEKQLIHLRRNYDVNSKMYSYLLEKKSENEMKKVATISDYEIIDRAYSNTRPVKPKKAMTLTIAFVLGLIIAMAIAYLRNLLIDKIQNIQDVKNISSLPIYGILTMLYQQNIRLEVFNNLQSNITSSFRNIRTNLQFLSKKEKGNTILITSSIEKEGKTTITANLSSIFQIAGYKSIVIDLDLYQPRLHKFFEIDHEFGISTYLNGKNTLGEIIFSTAHKGLDIIPAGPIAPNASELILSDRLKSLLGHLQNRYDYIFIDSAPFTTVADTLYLMQFSDINLIVIRENFTKKSFLSNLEQMINQHEFKNTGLILNTNREEATKS